MFITCNTVKNQEGTYSSSINCVPEKLEPRKVTAENPSCTRATMQSKSWRQSIDVSEVSPWGGLLPEQISFEVIDHVLTNPQVAGVRSKCNLKLLRDFSKSEKTSLRKFDHNYAMIWLRHWQSSNSHICIRGAHESDCFLFSFKEAEESQLRETCKNCQRFPP